MEELRDRGLSASSPSARSGRPRPGRAPAIEAINTESSRRNWSGAAGSVPADRRPTPTTTPPPDRPVVPAGAEAGDHAPGDSPRLVTVTIHQAWLARPDASGGSWRCWPALRCRRPRWRQAKPGPSPPPITRRPPPDDGGGFLPGSIPGPVPGPAGSGRCLGAPADEPTRRAGRRERAPRLGVEAGPRHEGPRWLRQEEGPAHEDRRMGAPAGLGGLPVRPPALYDPMTEFSCPRLGPVRGSAWAWCEKAAPQPMDRRATAEVSRTLVCRNLRRRPGPRRIGHESNLDPPGHPGRVVRFGNRPGRCLQAQGWLTAFRGMVWTRLPHSGGWKYRILRDGLPHSGGWFEAPIPHFGGWFENLNR